MGACSRRPPRRPFEEVSSTRYPGTGAQAGRHARGRRKGGHRTCRRVRKETTDDDDEVPSSPPLQRSRRAVRPTEREVRRWQGIEDGLIDVGAVGERCGSERLTRAAAVVIPDGQPGTGHRMNEIAYCQHDNTGLSRSEKYHRVLKPKTYYEYPERVRREAGRRLVVAGRSSRNGIRKRSMKTV